MDGRLLIANRRLESPEKGISSNPATLEAVGEVFLEAGLPPEVLNIINCRVPQAEGLITHPDIQTVMFTGSVPRGKRVMELASRNLTNIVLELGGKDPMIVCRDADLERAARGAVWAAFMNCGQSCAAVERLYVDRDIAEEFTSRVVHLTRQLRVKSPLEPDTDMGPMANEAQLKVVESHIRDTQERLGRKAKALWSLRSSLKRIGSGSAMTNSIKRLPRLIRP